MVFVDRPTNTRRAVGRTKLGSVYSTIFHHRYLIRVYFATRKGDGHIGFYLCGVSRDADSNTLYPTIFFGADNRWVNIHQGESNSIHDKDSSFCHNRHSPYHTRRFSRYARAWLAHAHRSYHLFWFNIANRNLDHRFVSRWGCACNTCIRFPIREYHHSISRYVAHRPRRHSHCDGLSSPW